MSLYFILLAYLTHKIEVLANLSMPGETLIKEEKQEMTELKKDDGNILIQY